MHPFRYMLEPNPHALRASAWPALEFAPALRDLAARTLPDADAPRCR